ncbi:MAG: hypothetical protein KatS3mg003_0224 [Candidatus Nitrosocaldaceae archaeon]|nr:MAG: hypothetical protein KatS3mg003_0224 [Candidatus Nitrosocaldaceae archaeon]
MIRTDTIILSMIVVVMIFSIVSATAIKPEKSAHKMLIELKLETVDYKDVSVAENNNYQSTIECVENMGIHYINDELASDLEVDEMNPEIILYEPKKNGDFRLTGVEYFVPAMVETEEGLVPWFGESVPEQGFANEAPILFNKHKMEGPMPGHDPNMPWHYDLHVWIWKFNTDGTFSSFNPRVNCNP